MKITQAHDYIQMRNGASFVGEVTQKTIKVEVGFSTKPLVVSVANILHIVFSNKYGYPLDEINLKDGSQLQGSVVDAEISFRSESLGAIKVPRKQILAIQLLGNL